MDYYFVADGFGKISSDGPRITIVMCDTQECVQCDSRVGTCCKHCQHQIDKANVRG